MTRFTFATLALAMLVACNEQSTIGGGGPDSAQVLPRSGRAKDSLIRVKDSLLVEKSRQLSLQSQLIGDAATSARLVGEIDRDLAKVRGLRVKGDTVRTEGADPNASEQLARVQQKVNALVSRLNASEARVRKMRNDSTTHAAFDLGQLRDYEQSIGDLRATVERQRLDITLLSQQVDSVVKVNADLAVHITSITSQNTTMAAREDSVFVAVGTERDLISRGVAREEGGNKLLFGLGKTLVPARNLDRSAFQAMSKTRDLAISLPKPDKSYRLVSRHSLDYVDMANPRAGVVRGSLKITDAIAFWAPSKYLILVER